MEFESSFRLASDCFDAQATSVIFELLRPNYSLEDWLNLETALSNSHS